MTDDVESPTLISRGRLKQRWGCSVAKLRRLEIKGLLHPVKTGGTTNSWTDYAMLEVHAIENGQIVPTEPKRPPPPTHQPVGKAKQRRRLR